MNPVTTWLLTTPFAFAAVRMADRWARQLEMCLATPTDVSPQEVDTCCFMHQFVVLALPIKVVALLLVVMAGWLLALPLPWTQSVAWLMLVVVLWMHAVIDARTGLLPDALTLCIFAIGFLLEFSRECTVLSWAQPNSLTECTHWLAALIGYGLPVFVNTVCRLRDKMEPIGMGDAKLVGALGIWLGLSSLLEVMAGAVWASLAYTAVYRLVHARLPVALPMGPFIAFATTGWLLVSGLAGLEGNLG